MPFPHLCLVCREPPRGRESCSTLDRPPSNRQAGLPLRCDDVGFRRQGSLRQTWRPSQCRLPAGIGSSPFPFPVPLVRSGTSSLYVQASARLPSFYQSRHRCYHRHARSKRHPVVDVSRMSMTSTSFMSSVHRGCLDIGGQPHALDGTQPEQGVAVVEAEARRTCPARARA